MIEKEGRKFLYKMDERTEEQRQCPRRHKLGAITLTVDSQADGFFGAGVEVGILCQACVVSSVHTKDLGDGELWSGVDLGVVVEPHILTGWIGMGLTQQGNRFPLQGRITPLCHGVRSHGYLRNVWAI